MTALAGKVAVVTGGGRGLGRATVAAMAAAGATVAVVDIDGTAAADAADELSRAGHQASWHAADVADEAAVHDAVAGVVAEHGRIDVLHNNAGLLGTAQDVDVVGTSAEVWDRLLAVNVLGIVHGCKHVVPKMLDQGSGAIVNTASTAGLMGNTIRHAYGTSKAAAVALTVNVATAYGRFGVRCNAVAPGFVLTDAAEALFSPDQLEMLQRNTPSARLGRPDDVAAAVVFLASDAAGYVNGQVLCVDGGFSCHAPYYADLVHPRDTER